MLVGACRLRMKSESWGMDLADMSRSDIYSGGVDRNSLNMHLPFSSSPW